jgi:hypothetical protein
MSRTILTKKEFAERVKRTPQCVSGWIAAGKITADALVGDGRSARIWLEKAMADLAENLDQSQQYSQSAPIIASSYPGPATIAAETLSEREKDLARRAKADADKAEHDAEAARRRLALDEGRYVVAEEAAASFRREMARSISETELFINNLARHIAENFNLDHKQITALAREDYRKFRSDYSTDAAARLAALRASKENQT